MLRTCGVAELYSKTPDTAGGRGHATFRPNPSDNHQTELRIIYHACRDSFPGFQVHSIVADRPFGPVLIAPRIGRIEIQEKNRRPRHQSRCRIKGSGCYGFLIALKISLCSGNLPVSFLEKIFLPSTTTSKTPPSDSINSGLTPNLSSIASARLTALGS